MRLTTCGTEFAGYSDWSGYISPGEVGVAGDLPARQIDRLEAGLDLLHRLVAGQRAERVDERLLLQIAPQLLRAQPRERVLDVHRAAQAHDVLGVIGPFHALPARIRLPFFAELLGRKMRHGGSRFS